MKKLSVLLLAMTIIFAFAGQAIAELTTNVGEDVFAGDQVITFNDFADEIECPVTTLITNQYKDEYGVFFADDLYGDEALSAFLMSDANTATNFNSCNFQTEMTIPGEPIMVSFDAPVTRVGFNGRSPAGAIIVTTFRGGVEIDSVSFDADLETFIGIEDLEGIDAIKIEGTGSLGAKTLIFFIDNLTFGGVADTGPTEIEVTMNVNPPNCLGASINKKSQGVIPVVIAGSEDFDVTTIDVSSVRLQGVAPVRTSIEDVPLCGSPEPDGFLDLTLKFDTQELVHGMGDFLQEGETLEAGDMVSLELSGNLLEEWGGALIEGEDIVTVVDKGKSKKCQDKKGKNKWHRKHKKHKHHKNHKNHKDKNKKAKAKHWWNW